MANPQFYDEMNASADSVRPHYGIFAGWLKDTSAEFIAQKREEADRAFHRVGITFAVYGEDAGTERLIPFDIIPRVIPVEDRTVLRSNHRIIGQRELVVLVVLAADAPVRRA